MAGRGTDIKLGDGVAELGGLHVICTEMHSSARLDRQFQGRSGRQSDPGTFRLFLALDDEILSEALGERKARKYQTLGQRATGSLGDMFGCSAEHSGSCSESTRTFVTAFIVAARPGRNSTGNWAGILTWTCDNSAGDRRLPMFYSGRWCRRHHIGEHAQLRVVAGMHVFPKALQIAIQDAVPALAGSLGKSPRAHFGYLGVFQHTKALRSTGELQDEQRTFQPAEDVEVRARFNV